jgi:repressor LexA
MTRRQAEILTFIASFTEQFGYPPTFREMMRAFGWSSSNSAKDALDRLQRDGHLTHEPGRPRTIRLIALAPFVKASSVLSPEGSGHFCT